MIGKPVAHAARPGGLELIDQAGDMERRMDPLPQRHRIGGSAECDQSTASVGQNFRERLLQSCEECGCQSLPAIVGDEDDMGPKRIDRMGGRH